eukprot:3210875-Karenia_brevis.AAC.1
MLGWSMTDPFHIACADGRVLSLVHGSPALLERLIKREAQHQCVQRMRARLERHSYADSATATIDATRQL